MFHEQILLQWLGICRCVYNLALETKIEAYRINKTGLSKFDLIKQLPELKKDFDWIQSVPSQTLQSVVERMDTAYQSFFRGGGFPKWAKKGSYNSLLFKQGIKVEGNKIQFPKLGKLGFFNSRVFPKNSRIRQATITKEVKGFFVSIVVEQPCIEQWIPKDNAIGLDMGVSRFATLSTGAFLENPRILKQYAKKLRCLNRSLARKKKGSSNWKKTKLQLSKLHLKIANTRKDFLHKSSTQLLRDNQTIVLEDLRLKNLRLKNMTKSAKGTLEENGKNVKQKSGLNRSLLDVAIGEFTRQLGYKSQWYGRTVITVNPKNTSRACSVCQHTEKENRKTQALFSYKKCGHTENADVNAAKNILARAELVSVNVGLGSCVGQESSSL